MKQTIIICDDCGVSISNGGSYSKVWPLAVEKGWAKGLKSNIHYCSRCAEKHQNEIYPVKNKKEKIDVHVCNN